MRSGERFAQWRKGVGVVRFPGGGIFTCQDPLRRRDCLANGLAQEYARSLRPSCRGHVEDSAAVSQARPKRSDAASDLEQISSGREPLREEDHQIRLSLRDRRADVFGWHVSAEERDLPAVTPEQGADE